MPCHASCATCGGSASTDCTACAASHPFADSPTSACVDDCTPLGKFANASQACAACDATCTTCSGPGAAECLSCAVEAYPFLHGATCAASCPDTGYYVAMSGAQGAQGTCAACAASCLSCSGPASTECLSCPSSGTPYFDDGACVASCPNGKFLDGAASPAACAACDATCHTCSGAGNASCLSCTAGVAFSSGACVSSCATGTYDSGGSCVGCDAACLTCDLSAANCTSCSASTYHQTNLASSSCVAQCANGTYASSVGACEGCDASCAACSGGTPSDCLSCPATGTAFQAADRGGCGRV